MLNFSQLPSDPGNGRKTFFLSRTDKQLTGWVVATVPYQFVPCTILLMTSAVMTLSLAAYGIRQRHTIGTSILALCMLIGTLWSVSNALEISALTFEHKLFWANLQYIAYSLGPVAWFLQPASLPGVFTGFSGKGAFSTRCTCPTIFWSVRSSLGISPDRFQPEHCRQYLCVKKSNTGPGLVHFVQAYALNFASIFLAATGGAGHKSVYRGQALFSLGSQPGRCL